MIYNKDTTIGEVIANNEKTKGIFMGFGMHCFSCPISQMETLEEASEVHGIELNLLLEKLNELEKTVDKKETKKVSKNNAKKTSK